jgi:hypothetical protein
LHFVCSSEIEVEIIAADFFSTLHFKSSNKMGNGASYYRNPMGPQVPGLPLKSLDDKDMRPDRPIQGLGASPAVGSTFIDPASAFALPSVNPIGLVPNIIRYGEGGFVVHNQSRDPRGDIDYLIPVKMPQQQASVINIGALLDRRHIPFITRATPPIAETTSGVTGALKFDQFQAGRVNENTNFDDIDREESSAPYPTKGTPVRVSEPQTPEYQASTPGYVSTNVGDYEIPG